MRTFPAITHVAVTVTDLAVSEPWYTKVLGVEPVLDEDTGPFRHIVYSLGGTLLGLHGFPSLDSDAAFDEHTAGLDHVAFGCADRDVQVTSPGGTQRVEWNDRGLFLTGWAAVVFEGRWLD